MPAQLQIRDPDKDRAQHRSSQALSVAGVEDLPETSFVCAGDEINIDQQDGFLRGHGTQVVDGKLIATLCGVVLRVDKLVSVRPVKSRYTAEVGDVVVGRVIEIAAKRWRIDMNARREAALMLSAVNLPGGVQRRRTAEDELSMRAVYEEGDLISAEVQSLNADGSVVLHTRSTKYGKLEAGQLIPVPANIVKRQKQHFHSIEALGVDMIIGCNGMIWSDASHYCVSPYPLSVFRPPVRLQ
ncbi:hypothetical protein WJX73_009950 [Symbiochloris irregularis]|uniref:S1 motif domain-containing protein n=1 Tax=Symbiochloris irregularis TaxID=706552 RepID=A0AAW1PSF9_9CHLO